MATGFVYHELYMWHNTGNLAGVLPFGFSGATLRARREPRNQGRMRNLLDASGLLEQLTSIEPREATDEGNLAGAHARAPEKD